MQNSTTHINTMREQTLIVKIAAIHYLRMLINMQEFNKFQSILFMQLHIQNTQTQEHYGK